MNGARQKFSFSTTSNCTAIEMEPTASRWFEGQKMSLAPEAKTLSSTPDLWLTLIIDMVTWLSGSGME
jgi:hypothetical protein